MEAPSPPGSAQRLRVLSFNVNGLRACLKRLHVSISQLLGLLNAGGMLSCTLGGPVDWWW
mgnify:CR=1 FL=1